MDLLSTTESVFMAQKYLESKGHKQSILSVNRGEYIKQEALAKIKREEAHKEYVLEILKIIGLQGI